MWPAARPDSPLASRHSLASGPEPSRSKGQGRAGAEQSPLEEPAENFEICQNIHCFQASEKQIKEIIETYTLPNCSEILSTHSKNDKSINVIK